MYDITPIRPKPMTRSGLVLGLYGGLALVAVLVSAGRGDPDIYRIAEVSTAKWLLLSPLLGAAIGLAIVAATRLAVYRFEWARVIHRDFHSLLGPLSTREIFVLAAASAVGEELLFRGALQPWIGLWPQAILFAVVHIGPGLRFLPWTASALVIAVGFGYVFQWTGDLGAPILAHFTVNYLNLHFISKVVEPRKYGAALSTSDDTGDDTTGRAENPASLATAKIAAKTADSAS